MDDIPVQPPTHLFTLRLWRAAGDAGQMEWRGKLQYVPDGEIRYFQGWPSLIAIVCALLSNLDSPGPDAGVDE